jgi:hypothetical protein
MKTIGPVVNLRHHAFRLQKTKSLNDLIKDLGLTINLKYTDLGMGYWDLQRDD